MHNFEFDLSPLSPVQPVVFSSTPLTEEEERLHERALASASRYAEAEAELLHVISAVDKGRLFLKFDLSSTFAYCLKHLGLSEAVAFNFINVARKCAEVPTLKEAIEKGELGVSKARKIVPVLTKENDKEWIQKAIELPQARLEREVAERAPSRKASEMSERMRPIKGKRVKIELNVSEDLVKRLRRAQDLVCGKRQSLAGLEEVLEELIETYLKREDPVRRADRTQTRCDKVSKPVVVSNRSSVVRQSRRRIPAVVEHTVNRRDRGLCQARRADGSQCGSRRFLHLHHIVPVSQGGANTAQNLITLCGRCHRRWHEEHENGAVDRRRK